MLVVYLINNFHGIFRFKIAMNDESAVRDEIEDEEPPENDLPDVEAEQDGVYIDHLSIIILIIYIQYFYTIPEKGRYYNWR